MTTKEGPSSTSLTSCTDGVGRRVFGRRLRTIQLSSVMGPGGGDHGREPRRTLDVDESRRR